MNVKRKVILQCLIAFTMLAAALLSPKAALAQDTAPEGDAETQTPEEPTVVPTEIPTEVPTEVATEAPTAVPTESTTEEAPTAEVTLTPTITPTEGEISAQVTVNLTSPTGNIHTSTPYFYWEQLEFAYRYELFVYQVTNKGTIKLYDISIKDSTYCNDDTGVCRYKPGKTLKFGNYEWNLRAYYDDGSYTEFNEEPMAFSYTSLVPTQKDPNTTIYDNPPVFTWTEVGDATLYQIQIYNKSGKKALDDATITPDCSEVNGESICSFTWSDFGTDYSYGWYKWRIRAYYNSTWRSYTGYTSFIVAPEDISTSFDSYNPDWVKHGGANWTLGTVDGNSVYYTNGGTKYWTSLRNVYGYSDFEIKARVKRDAGTSGEDGSYAASYIAVRMGASKSSNYAWYTGYLFGYTNAGTYSIWRMDSGTKAVAIQPWTEIEGTFNPGDWNELTVSANGSSFEFSINDEVVKSFTDNTYKKGYIGFEMYRADSLLSRFSVDSVEFTNLSGASIEAGSISAEQAAANQAALNNSSGDSFTSYDGGSVSAQATTPNPIEPVDTIVYVANPTFKWNDTGDSRYYLYLAKVSTGGIEKITKKSIDAATYCDGAECTYKYPSTLPKTDYMWKIQSYDGADTSAYSAPQFFTIGTTTPTAKQPYSSIYDNQPTFTWTEIVGAQKYRIVVYDSNGKEVVNARPEVTCDSDHICSIGLVDLTGVEGWVAPEYFENGKYKWAVRALINGAWAGYSPYRDFTVISEFDSDFETSSKGWSRLWGGSWARSNGYYATYGSPNKMSALKYAYPYSDFTFTARVKRDIPNVVYSSYPASYLAIRMGSNKTSSDYQWYPGYIFGYTNQGYYSIWRMKSGGGIVAIQPWTQISGDFYPGNWNTLSVTAEGNSFEFYINNELMTSFEDDTYSKGYVGFEAFWPGSGFVGRFYVDSAQLTFLGSTGLSAQTINAGQESISAEQQALNEAAQAAGESGSIVGTSF